VAQREDVVEGAIVARRIDDALVLVRVLGVEQLDLFRWAFRGQTVTGEQVCDEIDADAIGRLRVVRQVERVECNIEHQAGVMMPVLDDIREIPAILDDQETRLTRMERTCTALQERVLSMEADMNRIHVAAFVKEVIAEYHLSDVHSDTVADQIAGAT